MRLADSNIWLTLAVLNHEFHDVIGDWFASRARREVVFCRATQQSFLRLLTTAAVFARFGNPPLSNSAAWRTYEGFRADKRVGWAYEPSDIDRHWKRLSESTKASPKIWMDCYLAAFALAGGHQLVTTDKGFQQFKGLELELLPVE